MGEGPRVASWMEFPIPPRSRGYDATAQLAAGLPLVIVMAAHLDSETKHRTHDRDIASQANQEPQPVHSAVPARTSRTEDTEDVAMHASSANISAAERGHRHTIRLKLRDMSQLFNSMDPSPFIEKDLDDDAEEFIVSWAQEFSPDAPIKLRIYLEQWPADDPRELITTAVHNHFAHRAKISDLEFRRLLKQGRTSLFIGLVFLAVCLFLSRMLLARAAGTWAAVAQESLTIAGWVAMWRPMQIYLYDWWPLRRRRQTFVKLSHMPVEILQKDKT